MRVGEREGKLDGFDRLGSAGIATAPTNATARTARTNGQMSDRSVRLVRRLSKRHQDISPAAAPTDARSRMWLAILLIGAVAAGLYYAPFLGRYERALDYLATEAIAVVAVFASLRLNRQARPLAWGLFGLGMLAVALGDAVWYWLSLVQEVSPTTSLADILYLAEYPLLIAGMTLLVRSRPDRAVVLDTLMITTGVFVVVLEFVVRPSLEGYTGSALDLAVLIAYPIADVALLAVAVRSAFTGNLRSPVLRLLVAGLTATFFADVLSLRLSLMGISLDPSPLDAFWLISMVMWAAAATHPAARTVLAASGTDWIQRRIARRLLLAAALLLLPATLAVEASSGAAAYTPLSLVAWGVIVVLVILRMESALSVTRQSEERFRIIFEDSPAGMAIARRGLIVFANGTARSMFGAGQSDLRTMSMTEFIGPGHRREVIDRIETRAGGERQPQAFETVGMRIDGSQFPLVVETQDIFLPDGPATIGFLMDVSARKVAEETIRERALIAETIRDLRPGDTPEATAQSICNRVVNLTGVAAAGLFLFELDGRALPIGFVVAGQADPPLRRLSYQRSRHLHERAAEGPWIEPWINRPWHPYNQLLNGLGVHAAAYAPVRHEQLLIGLLVTCTIRSVEAVAVAEALPALVEFADLAGALIGRDVVERTEAGRGRDYIGAIIADRAFRPVFQPIVEPGTMRSSATRLSRASPTVPIPRSYLPRPPRSASESS
jgi:PAS domain S-box-containing protein